MNLNRNAEGELVLNSRFLALFRNTLLVILLLLGVCQIGQAEVGDSPASEINNINNPNYTNQYFYIVPPLPLWTCFDHSMNYSLHNPSWGMVLISSNPHLLGMGHSVNYKINQSDGVLHIWDGFNQITQAREGWEYDSDTFTYYHFYIDGEKPTRWFNFCNKLHIRPNAELVWSRYMNE